MDDSQQTKRDLQLKTFRDIKEVRVNFRFLHIFIKGGDKLQYILPPQAKLWEVKKKIDDANKRNFIFYLRESFIPSLDSTVGDIAWCYGRRNEDREYEVTLTASQNPHEYG